MAYTQLQPVRPVIGGAPLALTAAPAAGDAVRPGSFLIVNNGSGASITVTLSPGRTYRGYTISSEVVTVAAGVQSIIGPIDADPFEQLSGTDVGYCHVDYSAVTSVTRVSLATD